MGNPNITNKKEVMVILNHLVKEKKISKRIGIILEKLTYNQLDVYSIKNGDVLFELIDAIETLQNIADPYWLEMLYGDVDFAYMRMLDK